MSTTALSRGVRDPRHLMRFMKFQAITGSDAERIASIAKSERVSQNAVRASIRTIQQYRATNDKNERDYRINDYMMSVLPAAKESMIGLLTATELVEIGDPKVGKTKIVEQPDKTTRLEAQRIVKDLVVGTQPKSPIAEVNVHQTNQVANLSNAETTEERMDRLRKRAAEANLLPAEVAAVPGYLDRDEEPEDDDEGDEEEDSA